MCVCEGVCACERVCVCVRERVSVCECVMFAAEMQDHDGSHGSANGTSHKTCSHKRHFSKKGKCDGGIEVFTQRVIENLETRFVSSVCVAVIR